MRPLFTRKFWRDFHRWLIDKITERLDEWTAP